MKFLEDYLKDKCTTCNICCRFPERHSPLIPFFMGKERDSFYGCRIDVIKSGDGYICPYFLSEKNKCSIYSTRPVDCRLYPFMITYDNNYKKVILVLDKNCPYSNKLSQFNDDAKQYIDSLEIAEPDLGLINDLQPDTIFLEELPKLTEFVFGKSGRFRKLRLEDEHIIPYLWKDMMNVLYDGSAHYGINGNFKRFPNGTKDYIYLKKDLIELKGDKYKDKRNLCNYFQKNYSYKMERLSPGEEPSPCTQGLDKHLNLYKRWAENKKKKGLTLYCQQLIEDSFFFHRRAFLDFSKLNLSGIEIKIDNKLSAYTFGFGKEDIFYILGEIADQYYKGINQFIFREFCKIIPDNFIYVNTMDDSEIEGLRKNKLSYCPTE